MVFKEDIPKLYFAFNDRLKPDGKEQQIITCSICCLESPSHSKRSEICEMCFDTDFWEHNKEVTRKGTDMLWAIKATASGIIGNCYFARSSYWAGKAADGAISLARASYFQTKVEAESLVSQLSRDNAPTLVVVPLKIVEI